MKKISGLKISKAQHEVIDLMRAGWQLSALNVNIDVVRCHLENENTTRSKPVLRSTFDAINRLGLLKLVETKHRTEKYDLDTSKLADGAAEPTKSPGRIEVTMFEKPSDNVRGVVVALYMVKGAEKRIAHATLLTNAPADVNLTFPTRTTAEDVAQIANTLNQFAAKVRELEAGAT